MGLESKRKVMGLINERERARGGEGRVAFLLTRLWTRLRLRTYNTNIVSCPRSSCPKSPGNWPNISVHTYHIEATFPTPPAGCPE